MGFEEFKNKMLEASNKYFKEGTRAVINQVTKNNGVQLHGLTIMEDGCNIAPTIYLDGLYESYREGTTFSELFHRIVKAYEENKIEESINIEFFTEYESVRHRIVYKLINYDKNRELLEDIPHIQYLDLAIVFYCLMICDTFGNGSILIHNSHCKMWNVEAAQLYEDARANTPLLLGAELKSMEEVISDLVEQSEFADSQQLEEDVRDVPMYVLSNKTKIHGAACILYENVVKDFADYLNRDIFILPSSVHEVILVPSQGAQKAQNLVEMVREVNETQVEEEEILSDSVYYFSREDGLMSRIS